MRRTARPALKRRAAPRGSRSTRKAEANRRQDASAPPGWTPAEQAVHYRQAAQNALELRELGDWLGGRPPPERVLEIGVYLGGTAWYWRQLWPKARLVGVDLARPPCPSCERREAHRGCPRARVASAGMELVVGDSGNELTYARARHALGGPVGFLHIDGDHDYDAVRRDFELYAPLMERGGSIAFHDVCSAAYPGAAQLWQEVQAKWPAAFLIHEHGSDWGGFGVLPLPEESGGEELVFL